MSIKPKVLESKELSQINPYDESCIWIYTALDSAKMCLSCFKRWWKEVQEWLSEISGWGLCEDTKALSFWWEKCSDNTQHFESQNGFVTTRKIRSYSKTVSSLPFSRKGRATWLFTRAVEKYVSYNINPSVSLSITNMFFGTNCMELLIENAPKFGLLSRFMCNLLVQPHSSAAVDSLLKDCRSHKWISIRPGKQTNYQPKPLITSCL